jgi:hypothetical protein
MGLVRWKVWVCGASVGDVSGNSESRKDRQVTILWDWLREKGADSDILNRLEAQLESEPRPLSAHVISDAGAPVYVIAPEAWEAFVCERAWPGKGLRTLKEARRWFANRNGRTSGIEKWFVPVWREAEALARPFAQALLPAVLVADHKITVTAPANIGVDYGPDVGTLYAGDQIFVKLGAHR